MPSNQTTNYGLSQWMKSDQVKMEDFNTDNAKIDAALKAESDARAALAGEVSAKGNCQIAFTSYVGSNGCGAEGPNTLTFPVAPAMAFVFGGEGDIGILVGGVPWWRNLRNEKVMPGIAKWSEDGKTVSWYARNGTDQMSMPVTYSVMYLYKP